MKTLLSVPIETSTARAIPKRRGGRGKGVRGVVSTMYSTSSSRTLYLG